MLDFTSALYLGLEHSSASLPGWKQFTLGKPAALESPPGAEQVARELAELQNCESAAIGPSTLHIFLDLFDVLARQNVCVFVDSGTYPIARCGVERAGARGVPAKVFPHHNAVALSAAVARSCPRQTRPVIVTDGICTRCNRVAPLDEYLDLARNGRGWLVVDDTQALGILGERPSRGWPYGWGGGGASKWLSVHAPELLLVSSLAKGFGAPLAALAGSRALIDDFVRKSSTRLHCSPPSVPAIVAAAKALEINRQCGDELRKRLLSRVRQLRRDLAGAGLTAANESLFPVQSFDLPASDPLAVHAALLRRGIMTIPQRSPRSRHARLTVLMTAALTTQDIAQLAKELARFVQSPRHLAVKRFNGKVQSIPAKPIAPSNGRTIQSRHSSLRSDKLLKLD